jgi:type I restriction enzyme M protein
VLKLDADSEEALVHRILKSDLQDRLNTEAAVGRRSLVTRYRAWADKYAATLRDLESQRNAVAADLDVYLQGFGYA